MGWQQIGVVNVAVVDRAARAYVEDGRPPKNGCARLADEVHWETLHGPAAAGDRAKNVGEMDLSIDDPYRDC